MENVKIINIKASQDNTQDLQIFHRAECTRNVSHMTKERSVYLTKISLDRERGVNNFESKVNTLTKIKKELVDKDMISVIEILKILSEDKVSQKGIKNILEEFKK